MIVQVAEVEVHGAPLMVALVPSEYTMSGPGDDLIDSLWKFFPTMGVMLISVESNGYRSCAPFQTQTLLALLQLEKLQLRDLDLSIPPIDDSEPPF